MGRRHRPRGAGILPVDSRSGRRYTGLVAAQISMLQRTILRPRDLRRGLPCKWDGVAGASTIEVGAVQTEERAEYRVPLLPQRSKGAGESRRR